jgi:hypothetical protein
LMDGRNQRRRASRKAGVTPWSDSVLLGGSVPRRRTTNICTAAWQQEGASALLQCVVLATVEREAWSAARLLSLPTACQLPPTASQLPPKMLD